MTRESRLWLTAAGAVAVLIVAVVLLFGVTTAPEFPSLYGEGEPTVEATVAYVEYGRSDCVHVLDVASGDSREVFCDNWLHLEGWDSDGKLRIHSGNGRDHVSVVDPDTGEVLDWGEFFGDEPPPREAPLSLRSRSDEGQVTLFYSGDGTETTIIDVAGPRDYHFWDYGITHDGTYAWVCDSEEQLLLVALDGTGGPWLVADGVSEPSWK